MTTVEATRNLATKLKTRTISVLVTTLWDTAVIAAEDPIVQAFGTPETLREYLACYTAEIERRIEAAREEGKMSIVRSL